MIRQVLAVCLISIVLVSCSKNNEHTDPPFLVKARINGVDREFHLSAVAHKTEDGRNMTLVASGGYGASPFPTLSLYIESNTQVSAGAYPGPASQVAVAYAAASNEVYLAEQDFTINIAAISDTEVKGTFSGKVNGMGTLDISEGYFEAKFE